MKIHIVSIIGDNGCPESRPFSHESAAEGFFLEVARDRGYAGDPNFEAVNEWLEEEREKRELINFDTFDVPAAPSRPANGDFSVTSQCQSAITSDEEVLLPGDAVRNARKVSILLEAINDADMVQVDHETMLNSWNTWSVFGSPENEVLHMSWCNDEGLEFSVIFTEESLAGATIEDDRIFMEDQVGNRVGLALYSTHRYIPEGLPRNLF